MPIDSITAAQRRAVCLRAFHAWTEIAVCEGWLALFGPAEETTEHQLQADHANRAAARCAAKVREESDER